MTREEQFDLVHRFYTLNHAGDQAAAEELLTDDFSITIPPYLPFAGVYRGKTAFRELIPLVAESTDLVKMELVATTVGDGYAVEIVDFTLAGDSSPSMRVVEVIQFRDDRICEIRPFYFDATPMIAAAARRNPAAAPRR